MGEGREEAGVLGGTEEGQAGIQCAPERVVADGRLEDRRIVVLNEVIKALQEENHALQATADRLERDNDRLREQNDFLRKAIDVHSRRAAQVTSLRVR
jgi:predicted RNase H-like nuclease (RuvC/YqgF family)